MCRSKVISFSGSNLEDKVFLFRCSQRDCESYSAKIKGELKFAESRCCFRRLRKCQLVALMNLRFQDLSERMLQRRMKRGEGYSVVEQDMFSTLRLPGWFSFQRFFELKECYKLKSAGMSQKRCRWSEAFSVWWYMNCFEEAMTLGGFSGGAVFLVQTYFSSLLREESQVECVQENVKCTDIKAESERETVSGWSYFQQRILFQQSLGAAVNKVEYTEVIMVMFSYEKQVLSEVSQSKSLQEGGSGNLLIEKNTCKIEQVWSFSVKNARGRVAEETHHGLDIDVKEAVKKGRKYSQQGGAMRRDLLSFNRGSSSGFKAELARQKAGAFEVNQMGLPRNQVAGLQRIVWTEIEQRFSTSKVFLTRLSSWCLLALGICFIGFESWSFWIEAVMIQVPQVIQMKLMNCVVLLMGGRLKFPVYRNCQKRINEEVELNTRLFMSGSLMVIDSMKTSYEVELRVRGSKEQWQSSLQVVSRRMLIKMLKGN
ncbi:hypothetical protein F2Q70_00044765 [Brassica cretica]|uniref:Uncharacterized protein n=1 Tax=Brassica cretica TaxID=69181 RepID=A0A8S9KHC3_BRACR|nr:hypothetical protein F2Q70_00044765 [Brassica cretica]KAF2606270.1 hypothetical protein F2Q68_00045713 [Brassica cretica]